MLAGLGAMAIPAGDGLLWAPDEASPFIIESGACITLAQMTRAVLRYAVAEMPGPVKYVDDCIIGRSGLMRQQRVNLDVVPLTVDRYGLDRECYLKPMGVMLGKYLVASMHGKIETCGILPFGASRLPGAQSAIAIDPESGFSARGVRQFNIRTDEYVLFFDMVVG